MSEEQNRDLRIARYKPYYYKPVPGKTYLWCRCGRSRSQPFCDGSHKGTGFEPLRYVAEENGEVLFCGCKHTRAPPFCDGTHNNLRDRYDEDDPGSEANRCIADVVHDRHGRFELNGACYVARIDRTPSEVVGNCTWRRLATRATGARHQSAFHLEIAGGWSPVVACRDSEVVMLATEGAGKIDISGRMFALGPETGIYARPGEAFRIHNPNNEPIRLHLAICPQLPELVFARSMSDAFDVTQPERVVRFDAAKRQRMGDRTFQLLVSAAVGSRQVTQFIGTIPFSKAAPHRHLYEEVLIVLRGEGMMWTEDLKARVRAGDFVFLPARQIHSLQCTDRGGMLVAGVIYPGGNPNINF